MLANYLSTKPMIKFFSIIGAVFLFSPLQAQDFNNGRTYFFLGLRLPMIAVRDVGHSPLIYRGFVPTLIIGYEKNAPDFVSRFEVSVGIGEMSPTMKPRTDRMLSNAQVNNIELTYSYLRGLNTFALNDWNNYVGGKFSVLMDVRVYNLPSNNLMGYHMNTSLSVAARTQKKISDAWLFHYEAAVPLLAYSVRPNYNGTFPDVAAETGFVKKFIKSGSLVSLPTYFRFTNNFSFTQNINDGRERRLSYQWDYLYHAKINPLNYIYGGLGYESLFKL